GVVVVVTGRVDGLVGVDHAGDARRRTAVKEERHAAIDLSNRTAANTSWAETLYQSATNSSSSALARYAVARIVVGMPAASTTGWPKQRPGSTTTWSAMRHRCAIK